MINVANKKCSGVNCKKSPSFGYEEDGIRRYYKDHKTNDMIDVKHKKCKHHGCKKSMLFHVIVTNINYLT